MKRRLNRAFLLVPMAGLVVSAVTSASQPLSAGAAGPVLTQLEKRLYFGVGPDQFSTQTSTAARSAASRTSSSAASPSSNFTPTSSGGPQCGLSLGSNVKVNQGCLNITATSLQGRGQAHNETAIAVNPFNPQQLVAASNDYTLGDGLAGGIGYSSDGGKTWQDSTLPVEFTRGSDFSGNGTARMYWQGGGDPSLAWDSRGNAYFAGLHFNRGTPPIGVSDNPDYSSGVYVYRSIGNGGASWTFPGTPVATQFSPTTPANGVPLLDKPYIAIDNHKSSPFRDRIYVSYTNFAADGTAYIYEAWSSDYGRSFSSPVLVSQNSSICPNDYSQFGVVPTNGSCDENQFSDPFTGADGNLYVVYDNYNTNEATNLAPNSDNRTQILLSKSTDGGVSFGEPVQVGFYYDLPDCGTYQGGQDEFRACIPEQGAQQNSVFRGVNYPSGAVDPTNNKRIAITYGSYINRDSNASTACTPNGTDGDAFVQLYNGVKTGACANKILVSVSKNKGASFSATGADPRTVTVVPQRAAQAHTDQFWQWSGFDNAGQIVVSYYDRQYGADITNASMDITLSTEGNGEGDNARSSEEDSQLSFASQRVTSSSMPSPTQFPDAQGNSVFFGDYSGLAVANTAHPLWMDTREPDLFDCGTNPPAVCTATSANGNQANTEDIFTASIRP
jgi:hypothetical protein